MDIDSSVITRAILHSIRNRAFSKRQTLIQKLIAVIISLFVFSVLFSHSLILSLIFSLGSFIYLRWLQLGVFNVKEGVILVLASLYTLFLVLVSYMYSLLYRNLLKKIKTVQFFPEFPYNEQTFTLSMTAKEVSSRDKFWGPRLSKGAPSPNSLTIIRIVGAVSLLFLHDLNTILFLIVALLLVMTDYFDGIIARTQNRETDFGIWADPIADRMLLISIAYFIYLKNSEFWNINLAKILLPETIVLVLGVVLLIKGRSILPRPVFWGRLKFTLYCLTVVILILGNYEFANLVLLLGCTFAFVAVMSYITRAYQEIYNKSIFNGILCWFASSSFRIRDEVFELK